MNINESLEDLKKILTKSGLKISCAESLTTGHVQTMLGQLSGSSDFFEGGITAYQRHQKVKHLHVDNVTALMCNCVSERTAAEMAVGVTEMFGTDIGIATTGYASPDLEKRVIEPYAYFAIFIKNGLKEPKLIVDRINKPKYSFSSDDTKNKEEIKQCEREQMQRYVAEQVICRLLKEIKLISNVKG